MRVAMPARVVPGNLRAGDPQIAESWCCRLSNLQGRLAALEIAPS